MAKKLISAVFIAISLWFLFTFKLTDVPPGINGDEAAIGYSAALISKTGYDKNGRFLPLFTTVGWPDWKQPVTIYSTALIFKLFGISYFNLKAVSVIFVLISGMIIFFLAKEIFDQRIAIVSLFIFATIPIIAVQSHLAMENIAPVPFVALWLWMIVKYSKAKKSKYLFLAGVALGISLYSYLGLRLIMPILAFLTVAYLYYLNRKSSLRPVSIFIVALMPFLSLLLVVRDQYPAAVFALNKPQNVTSYQDFLLPFVSSFDLSFLFMKGDSTPYHSTGREGMFLLATLPLFILGLTKIATEKKHIFIFILLVFFLAPLLYGLPGSIHRASRLLSLIPPFIIIILLGVKFLAEIKSKIKIYLILVIMMLILVNFKSFLTDYWFEYPQRVNQSFEKPVHQVYEKVARISKEERLKIFIHDDIPIRNMTAYTFLAMAYLGNNFQRWEESKELPKRSIVMVTEQVFGRSLKGIREVEVLEHGNMDLILVINRKD